MQLLGEGRQDKADVEYASGDLLLIRTVSGSFQFGIGRDARIVKDLSEVATFGPDVQGEVARWLKAQGPARAMQEKTEADIHEQSMGAPGSVDARLALLDKAAPGLKGEITSLIDSILVKHGLVPAASDALPATGPQSAGRYRVATPEEVRMMSKAGLPYDPTNPPKVWDPEGELAGPASQLRDAPDNTAEMLTERKHGGRIKMPSAQDILGQEEDEAVHALSDELAEEPAEV